MSLSSFSLVLGVFLYVYGFPMVFSDDAFTSWYKRVLKDVNAQRLIGMVFAALAITTLRYHWRVTPDGEGIMVAVVWAVFVKGLFMAWWPATCVRMRARGTAFFLASPPLQAFAGFLMVLMGALFTYFGLILI